MIPIRGPATISTAPARAKSSNGGASSAKPYVPVGDAQRLAQPAGAGAQEPLVGDAAPPAHHAKAGRRLDGPDQHGAGRPCRFADEVQAPVNAVGAIDIGVARRSKHDGIAAGHAAKAVRRRVGMMVGLDFDQPAADPVHKERRTDQIGRNLVDAAVEKATGQSFRHAPILSTSAALGKSPVNTTWRGDVNLWLRGHSVEHFHSVAPHPRQTPLFSHRISRHR